MIKKIICRLINNENYLNLQPQIVDLQFLFSNIQEKCFLFSSSAFSSILQLSTHDPRHHAHTCAHTLIPPPPTIPAEYVYALNKSSRPPEMYQEVEKRGEKNMHFETTAQLQNKMTPEENTRCNFRHKHSTSPTCSHSQPTVT